MGNSAVLGRVFSCFRTPPGPPLPPYRNIEKYTMHIITSSRGSILRFRAFVAEVVHDRRWAIAAVDHEGDILVVSAMSMFRTGAAIKNLTSEIKPSIQHKGGRRSGTFP